ncbi:MAG: cellulase family glycosylhydrolase, partial [Akkermansiaceae bacterium]|nr:cellulase family glycosylhydrolase [Akkermansiaceae bacterium]
MSLISRWSCRLCLLLLVCLLWTPSQAQVLRVHPDHSRLLEFRGEPVILKTLAEHYGSVINPDFNYIPYLNTLQANGMNLTRVVLVGFHANSGDFNDTLNPSLDRYLQPWPRRTTSGLALDGRGKWDLSTWNEAYFTRLRAFVQACSDRGIIVELTLFNTYYFANQWELSPFNPLNNMQGFGPNTGTNSRYDAMRPVDANLYAAQQAVVRRIVRDMNPYDNVYFEIQNEPFWNQPGIADAAETTFHNTMLAAIRNEESTLPNRHLVAHNFPQRIATLTDDFDIINCHYPFAVPSTTIIGGENLLRDFYSRNRPLSMDETNMAGPIEARLESWMFLMGGGVIYNGLDQGSNVYSISDPAGNSAPAPAIRAGLRNLAGYINALDILSIRRDLSWIVSGTAANAKAQAMSKPGQQYTAYFYHGSFSAPFQVVYAPIDASNHTTNLRVNLPAGSYRAVWTRPSDMFTLRVETFTHGGGEYVMQPVTYQEDVALRIDRTGAGDTTAPPPPADLVASINSQGGIQLAWPAVPAADLSSYRVYRYSGSGTPTFVGAPLATTASNVISYTDSTAAGGMEHRYVVKAVDNQGNESRRSKIALAVAPINFDPPSANAGTDQYFTDSDRNLSHAVVLNGSASVAGDRPIVSHVWKLAGLQIASGVNPTAILAAGIHDVELTVTDDVGLSGTDIVRIFISNPDFNNGSFESSLTAPFTPGGHSMLAEGLAGWTLQGETDALTLFAGHNATNGNTVLVFNGGGKPAGNGITQTFPTVPGKTYIVDFDLGVVAYNTTTQQRLTMQVRGNTLQPLQTFNQNGNISGGNNQNVVWTARTFSFVADSTITSLIVKDASPNVTALDLVLDHVRVRAQADRELTVSSLPTAGVSITVTPSDLNGAGSGSTPFNRNFQDGSSVTLTAPLLSGNLGFQRWMVDGVNAGNANPLVLNLTANRAVVAVYESGPPVILNHPASLQAAVGDAIQFSVSAAGTGTLSYQWRFNGADLPGANTAQLQIPNVSGLAAGTYGVRVSSNAGMVESLPATLAVKLPDFPNGSFEDGIAGWTVTGNAFLLGPYPGYAAAEGSQLIVFNGGNTAPNGMMTHAVA